jgi:FlaA1/EpsC-like NDP-sugar epimerase
MEEHGLTGTLARGLKERFVGLSRRAKQALMVACDVVGLPLALFMAFALKADALAAGLDRSPWLYAGVAAASVPALYGLGLYRSVVRFIGPRAMLAMLGGVTVAAVALAVMGATIAVPPVPATVTIIFWLLAFLWVAGTRFLVRWVLAPVWSQGEPVLIYGAGQAGASLAMALRSESSLRPVGYVDEKRALHGTLVKGIPVFNPGQIEAVVGRHGVRRILLAVPTASRKRRATILRRLEQLGLHVQSVPSLDEIVTGRAQLSELRDVEIGDLLGRDPVPPNQALLDRCIRDKVVMVTGAGGSIGSELCRQIIRQGPRRLVLVELSELALYQIERDLRGLAGRERLEVDIVALLGNTHHRFRMHEILKSFGVQTVYHAAAYKHVPIVEHNLVEGVYNNVFSTLNVAESALETGVETFVLVSTDKAVNPTNVMGATKRFAEIVLQALQARTRRTRFCMVRFGNVLGSSGSVVPLFEEQIRAGVPVTVTHPEVRRFFMTIPEAAQLVLQAGSMGEGGDVFVLDMGEPVRIDELARRMIALMGLTVRDEDHPDGDVEIRYTGLRPGEKLYEELLIGSNVTGTDHPMIVRAMEHSPAWDEVLELLEELRAAIGGFDCKRVLAALERGVREYVPAPDIVDLVWQQRVADSALVEADRGKIAVLADRRAQRVPPIMT